MYSVEWEQAADEQARTLPAEALPSYAELVTLLEIGPWSGSPFNPGRPDGNMLMHAFGKHLQGTVTYLVLEDQRRVIVLRVTWVG